MPAVNESQRRFFGAEYGRSKAGQPTKTGMGRDKLRDFARKPARSSARRMTRG